MIQDYFSIDRLPTGGYLFRIINKVDFVEEIVWAKKYPETLDSIKQINNKLLNYLVSGFDTVEAWSGDQECWHEITQHLGFINLLSTFEVFPEYILWKQFGKANFLPARVFYFLEENKASLNEVLICSKVGSISDVLKKLGTDAYTPKVANADIYLPLRLAFDLQFNEINDLIKNYS